MPVLAAPPEAPGAVEVKLLLLSVRIRRPRGSSLLFAVGAGPPHDGVRRARCLNLDHDLASLVRRLWTLNEVASPIGLDRPSVLKGARPSGGAEHRWW